MTIDARELYALSRDLSKIGATATASMFGVFKEAGDDLKNAWRENARATSGVHGKHYPDSITADMKVSTNIEVEVGPDPRLRQGGMSFEYGSVNQPPHLDGQRAADTVIPLIDRRIDIALAHLGV